MRLFDPKRSPLPHLPWIIACAFRAAPVELSLNLAESLISGSVAGVMLLLTQRVVDGIAPGAPPEPFLRNLVYLGVLLLINQITGAVAPVTNNYIQDKTARHTRYRVLEKAASLSLVQFDRSETYDLIHRATNNVPGPAMAMAVTNLYQMAGMVIRVGSAIAFVGSVSPWVAAGACLAALPIGWAGTRQGNRLFTMHRQQTKESRMATYLTSLMTERAPATELRAYQLLRFFIGRWQQVFRRQTEQQQVVLQQGMREGWLADLAAAALYLGALAYFTGGAEQGLLTAGTIVAVAGAIRLLRGSATGLAQLAGTLWTSALPLLDLRTFLELQTDERPLDQGLPFPAPLVGAIRFEQVSFAYPGKAEPVLTDISLEIKAGERVAVVGANGAGKSTLIKLLLGLYQPTAGRITYDGRDVQQIAPASLRANVSCIFQDFSRYQMTVGENIALGRPGAPEVEVRAAVRRAGAEALVESLLGGLETMLGKQFAGGIELSGGQWQRVALARAFVRDAQLIVLDEPTAALDPRAELELFGKFVDLAGGRTAVLISHRLGVARLADRVIVLDSGRVAENGTHAELLAAGGLYAKLFRSQAQWYEEEAAS
jgi:ATP-binding cassette, subfamily B, bacterial